MIKILTLFIFFSFSCLGKTLPPPKIQLDAIKRSITEGIDRELPRQEMWAKRFLTAKALGRNKTSCKLFKDLAKEKSFPLKDMAFIYELRSCHYSKDRLKKIWRKKIDTRLGNRLQSRERVLVLVPQEETGNFQKRKKRRGFLGCSDRLFFKNSLIPSPHGRLLPFRSRT